MTGLLQFLLAILNHYGWMAIGVIAVVLTLVFGVIGLLSAFFAGPAAGTRPAEANRGCGAADPVAHVTTGSHD